MIPSSNLYELRRSALGALDAVKRKEFWASLALKHTKGLGGRSYKKLLTSFGSAFEALQHIKRWNQIGIQEDKIIICKSEAWRNPAKKEWEAVRGCYGTILLWTDPRYPSLLKEISDPPIFLYCLGDLSLLSNPCIAIVGTRKCSVEGVRATKVLAEDLSCAGITVVSGMALGIDRQAHLAAINFTGRTIGVLGSGVDINYPRQNKDVRERIIDKGLLISEYAPGTHPEPNFFPTRNRIISGLSLGIVVVEAAVRSGSLITARLALEQNRCVYAIPGAINSPFAEGCQDLIREGARPIFSAADIIEDLAAPLKGSITYYNKQELSQKQRKNQVDTTTNCDKQYSDTTRVSAMNKEKSKNEFDELELLVLSSLASEAKNIEILCQELQIPIEEMNVILILLEVRGVIQRLPTTQYTLI